MYFKLEPQPVNHGDYALPRCVLSGSGGISSPVRQLSAGSGWVLRQSGLGKAAPAALPVLGCEPTPRAFPAQPGVSSSPGRVPAPCPSILVVSSVLAGAASRPHARAKTPEITADPKNQGAKHPGGVICSPKPCFVAVRASAPCAVFAFRQEFHDSCFR